MRKYLIILLTMMAGFAFAESNIVNQTEVPSSIEGISEKVEPAFQNPQKSRSNIPVTFINQPPLVPHSIRGLQVTKNVNQCLGCHGLDFYKTTGAPRLPQSHFITRDGEVKEGESPRRYFCLQCHVQQTDVDPIVQNKFETIKRTQNK
ncbi:nitrate reductase cytochrome c-type subunit [Pasteurella bettyae]|uniref:Periplasmic nitrate reductase, electron transfer subunit n=1 Tax=Pasteurella bettyae CCUG 2042 TaxID=1095749 RepID=I3DBI9_9PAST|nr:nitrate reductase cytochrome c-type subunit [Pasteurella bettyae]EIJ69082.1 periplasmic nitrate reductase, diheme cytochrome c subunit [Pasteurella bettyae CCUG 2042]SUB22839.1 diheme cytochrome c NapB [Pasteurella bettyae]